MSNIEIRNDAGIKFLIERAADIDDNGRFVSGNGWFASPMKGNSILGGTWFQTKESAAAACLAYEGEI